jgi:two-component system phosphate regulon response regulator PhoB
VSPDAGPDPDEPVRPPRVLVVEDDEDTRRSLLRTLLDDGLDVVEASDGVEALGMLAGLTVDLVLLDLGIPRLGGLDVLTALRLQSHVPVIIVSGRGDEADRALGIELGADDYIAKPVYPRELLARVRAVLRRVEPAAAAEHRLVFGDLQIDRLGRDVRVAGQAVRLTAREFDLLVHLAGAPRSVFSREQLLNAVWHSSEKWQDPSTVTELVRRVRLKIESDPDRPRWIRTVRGAGYRFEP